MPSSVSIATTTRGRSLSRDMKARRRSIFMGLVLCCQWFPAVKRGPVAVRVSKGRDVPCASGFAASLEAASLGKINAPLQPRLDIKTLSERALDIGAGRFRDRDRDVALAGEL